MAFLQTSSVPMTLVLSILSVVMQILLARDGKSISVSLSVDGTALIIDGSEWSPIFITSYIKETTEGTIAQKHFQYLRIQIDNHWHSYAYIGSKKTTNTNKLQFKLLHQTISPSTNAITEFTKDEFITKCNNKQVAFDDDKNKLKPERFIVPKQRTFPLLFHSTKGPNIVWNQQQFAKECNDGNIASHKNLFGAKKLLIGAPIRRNDIQLDIRVIGQRSGLLSISKIADDATGHVWKIMAVPQGEYYFELRDDRGKFENYQFLGAFEFDNGESKIVITNIGQKGVNKDKERVFIWSKEEFIDECHSRNIGWMHDKWGTGVDLIGTTMKKNEHKLYGESRVEVRVSMGNGMCGNVDNEQMLNVYGVMKHGWKRIAQGDTVYIKQDNKWVLYTFMGGAKESFDNGEGQKAYEIYDDDYYYEDVYRGDNEKLIRLIRLSERLQSLH